MEKTQREQEGNAAFTTGQTEASDLAFLTSGYMPRCAVNWKGRFDDYSALQFMSAGKIDLAYNDRAWKLEGAWFWPGYAGPLTTFRPSAGQAFWCHRYVTFCGPLVNVWQAQGLLGTEPQAAPPESEGYEARFDELRTLALRSDRWGRLRAVNLLEQILLELAEARAQTALSPAWLEPLRRQLALPAASPDYARLAAEAGLSLTGLRQKFKAAMGLTLHEYVLQTRLTTARTLLEETDLPLKAIAAQVGYSDIYFFTRQFQQRVGVPPGLYRRSRQT